MWTMEMLEAIAEAKNEIKDDPVESITIRPHPTPDLENVRKYREFLKKRGIKHCIDEKTPLYDQILAHDLIFSVSSTTVIETLLLRKPLVLYSRHRQLDNLFDCEEAPYPIARSKEDVKKILKDPLAAYLKGLIKKKKKHDTIYSIFLQCL